MTSQRLVEEFARWLWVWDMRWEPGETPPQTERIPDGYLNHAAVFLAGELGQRLQHEERDELREQIVDRLHRLELPREPDDGPFLRGYREALDMSLRVVTNQHSIVECCNSRCSSPIRGLHCFECEELDLEYDAGHIRHYVNDAETFPAEIRAALDGAS